MLVIKIELHSAVTGNVSEIGRMHISNDGTGERDRGNYRVEIFRKSSRKIHRAGEVKNFARLSSSVWLLLVEALHACKFSPRKKLEG